MFKSVQWLSGAVIGAFLFGVAGCGGTSSSSSSGGHGGSMVTSSSTGGAGGMSAGGAGGAACDPATCPHPSSECVEATCNAAGACAEKPLADGTAAATQTAGDCQKAMCKGGLVTAEDDDGDVADDGNDCTADTCAAGAPEHAAKALDAPCGAGGTSFCDGAGHCVGCNAPAQCPGQDGECQTRSCAAGVCGIAFAPLGTPTMSQTMGDCHQMQCDGAGLAVSVPDAGDPEDDGNACTDDACDMGAPTHAPTPIETSCGVGLKCDGAGSCVGCTSAADCQVPGNACLSATCVAGMCGTTDKAEGTACNDGNACTQSDTCQAGACTGQSPVVCAAPDQCHSAGACDVATGACSNPNKADGTACSDGSTCTQTDTCLAGICTGQSPVTCAVLDPCHILGACNPVTGVCSNPNQANGTACDDGNACTQSDTCQAGTCVGQSPVICAAVDQCHTAGVCDMATGMCSSPSKPNGTACSDGNACTQTDTCQVGACVGQNLLVCPAIDQCHKAGVCDAVTGVCVNSIKPNGTACNDGNTCTQTDACQAGVCVGANPVVCAAQDQCHSAGVCAAATGVCSNPNKANGTACNDGNGCTQTDTCQAGVCTGANPVVCAAQDQCHSAGVCAPATGVCSNPNKANGTACNDGNGCTQTDTCQAGTCTGANPVVCAALDQCHSAGVCAAATGVCSNPNKADGSACMVAAQAGTCGGGACMVCGNGITEGTEQCDDNNAVPCDGCSPKCQLDTSITYATAAGLAAALIDDGYNGTQASMTCINITVLAAGDNLVDYVCPMVGMTHTWIGDLTIKLISPANTVITLMSMPGVVEAADNGASVTGDSSNLLATFPITWKDGGPKSAELMGNTLANSGVVCRDDAACVYDPNNGAAAAGKLAAFIGQAGPGTWKLCVGDSGLGDIGSIDQVKLVIGQ